MNHTILIVEDKKEIADTRCYALSSASMNTQWVTCGANAKRSSRYGEVAY